MREQITAEYLEMAKEVKQEPMPDSSAIYDHVFYGQGKPGKHLANMAQAIRMALHYGEENLNVTDILAKCRSASWRVLHHRASKMPGILRSMNVASSEPRWAWRLPDATGRRNPVL